MRNSMNPMIVCVCVGGGGGWVIPHYESSENAANSNTIPSSEIKLMQLEK